MPLTETTIIVEFGCAFHIVSNWIVTTWWLLDAYFHICSLGFFELCLELVTLFSVDGSCVPVEG